MHLIKKKQLSVAVTSAGENRIHCDRIGSICNFSKFPCHLIFLFSAGDNLWSIRWRWCAIHRIRLFDHLFVDIVFAHCYPGRIGRQVAQQVWRTTSRLFICRCELMHMSNYEYSINNDRVFLAARCCRVSLRLHNSLFDKFYMGS